MESFPIAFQIVWGIWNVSTYYFYTKCAVVYDDGIFHEMLSVAIHTVSACNAPLTHSQCSQSEKTIKWKKQQQKMMPKQLLFLAVKIIPHHTCRMYTPQLNMSLQICVNEECIMCERVCMFFILREKLSSMTAFHVHTNNK